jgi:drug/metabolite transporter (DMT)-like permease
MTFNEFSSSDSNESLLKKDPLMDYTTSNDHLSQRLVSLIKSSRGILIGVIGAFFFALFAFFNKQATFTTGPEQSALRYFIQFLLMSILVKCNTTTTHQDNHGLLGPKEHRKLLLIRGTFGAISFISIGLSIKYIDESTSQALFNARLVLIPVIAAVYLKEKLKFINIICFILTLIGVVLICQPSFQINKIPSNDNNIPVYIEYIGICMGLVACIAASCVAILLKKLTNLKVHYSINVIYSSYMGFPTALAISLFMYAFNMRQIDPSVYDTNEKLLKQIVFSLTSALCGCMNQILVAISNKYENANKLALVSTSNLLWSYVLEYVFHKFFTSDNSYTMNVYATSGALFIFLACVASIIANIYDEKRVYKS